MEGASTNQTGCHRGKGMSEYVVVLATVLVLAPAPGGSCILLVPRLAPRREDYTYRRDGAGIIW